MAAKLPADGGVMARQQPAPGVIAQSRGQPGRPHHVGHQEGVDALLAGVVRCRLSASVTALGHDGVVRRVEDCRRHQFSLLWCAAHMEGPEWWPLRSSAL
jgi:hypothetical protein